MAYESLCCKLSDNFRTIQIFYGKFRICEANKDFFMQKII